MLIGPVAAVLQEKQESGGHLQIQSARDFFEGLRGVGKEAGPIVKVFKPASDVGSGRQGIFRAHLAESGVLLGSFGVDAVDDKVGFADKGESGGCVPSGVRVKDVFAAVGARRDVGRRQAGLGGSRGKAGVEGGGDIALFLAEVVVDVPDERL